MKLMQQRQQPDRQQPRLEQRRPDQRQSDEEHLPSLQSDSSSPPTSSMHRLSVKEAQSPPIPSSSSLETSHQPVSTGSQKKGSAGQRWVGSNFDGITTFTSTVFYLLCYYRTIHTVKPLRKDVFFCA